VNYTNHEPKEVVADWTETSMKNNSGTVFDDAASRTQYRAVFGQPGFHK